MKNLTKKFREIFQNYDYDSENISVLSQLLDIIITMMTVTDHDDVNNIQKLASFLKIFSSGFCLDIMDENMIDEIYENQILPIFIHFDEKYENVNIDDAQKLVNEESSLYYNTEEKKLEEKQVTIPKEVNIDTPLDKSKDNDDTRLLDMLLLDFPVQPEVTNNNRGDPNQDLEKERLMLFIVTLLWAGFWRGSLLVNTESMA